MARARYPVTVTFRVAAEVAERLERLGARIDKGDWLRAVVEAALEEWEARKENSKQEGAGDE